MTKLERFELLYFVVDVIPWIEHRCPCKHDHYVNLRKMWYEEKEA
jgi:hypothetical protein